MYTKSNNFVCQLSLTVLPFGSLAVQAQTYKVLHNFGALGDGSQPIAPLQVAARFSD
jgi:hypothetical protein